MTARSCICPVCFQRTLAEMVGRGGEYWQCLNLGCGRSFLPEQLYASISDAAMFDWNKPLTEDPLEVSKRYRIPTTVEGQIYELRRMFRR